MLFDGTFGVWFPTCTTRVSALFRSATHSYKHYGFHSRKFSSLSSLSAVSIRHTFLQTLWLSFSQVFLSLVQENIVSVEGEENVTTERTNDRIASSISHTGADRFPGNEPANYRMYNLEIELAKVSACCHLVNRPGNSDCQPLGNIFHGDFVHPLNKLNREPASHAIEYVLPRKAVCQFVDAEIANHRLMDPGIGLVNALRIALNLQLIE